jgi:hypothetical protein
MITVIICGVIGFFIGVVVEGDDSWLMKMAVGFLFGLIGLFMGVIVGLIISGFLPTTIVLEQEIELVALKDTNGVNGKFFLGCGNIHSNWYYVFYTKDPDGKIKFNRLSADDDDVSIVEEERQGGTLKVYGKEFAKKSYKNWGLIPRSGSSKYEIHVPKGTVITDFNLDLQ